ncbi:hypothetical protein B296_00014877 [Ensete ventricosum]|uniref:Uncharacterized protein n=1 Tax=Ensete ventricosum TaxID=4639 RepID=A0A426ZH01_ENSVE|nr:hypothetical protein B296_00014877 [Ensete ventricosum]
MITWDRRFALLMERYKTMLDRRTMVHLPKKLKKELQTRTQSSWSINLEDKADLKTTDDAVGNSSGVRRELTEGIESFPGWRKGVPWKKTKTRWKIVGGSRKACRESYRSNMDPRSSLGIGPRIGRCDESSSGVRQDFVEGIEKITRNTSRDRQRKTMRLVVGDFGGCRIVRVRS